MHAYLSGYSVNQYHYKNPCDNRVYCVPVVKIPCNCPFQNSFFPALPP